LIKLKNNIINFLNEDKCDQIQPQNLDLAAFILAHTLENLIHAALAEPDFFANEQFEQELTVLLLRYLKSDLMD
jgi:hypothetical protein